MKHMIRFLLCLSLFGYVTIVKAQEVIEDYAGNDFQLISTNNTPICISRTIFATNREPEKHYWKIYGFNFVFNLVRPVNTPQGPDQINISVAYKRYFSDSQFISIHSSNYSPVGIIDSAIIGIKPITGEHFYKLHTNNSSADVSVTYTEGKLPSEHYKTYYDLVNVFLGDSLTVWISKGGDVSLIIPNHKVSVILPDYMLPSRGQKPTGK